MTGRKAKAAKFFSMLSRDHIAELYRLHNRELFRYLYRLSGSAEAAEDLLQETFEKFIRYTAETPVQEDKIRAFLYRTAHNLCVNHLVRAKRTHPRSLDDLHDTLKTEDRHDEGVALDELNKAIYRILAGVDPEARSIFVMHKENGMTYEEIAADLDLSARTARRRVREVTDLLYRELKKEGFME